MKRSLLLHEGEVDSLNMANCLVLLSQGREPPKFIPSPIVFESMRDSHPGRVFECKTCNRQFPSFQALGGHRASHKKPRLMDGSPDQSPSPPAKAKTHECSICGLEFTIGQALGGHMRRHRTAALRNGHHHQQQAPEEISAFSSVIPSATTKTQQQEQQQPPGVPIEKKYDSSRRVLCLDLNLTPFENDLHLMLGKAAPMVDCFF